jgi:hypothetical protein
MSTCRSRWSSRIVFDVDPFCKRPQFHAGMLLLETGALHHMGFEHGSCSQ